MSHVLRGEAMSRREEFEICRQRTPEEDEAVERAEAIRGCPCWRGEARYDLCDKRMWGECHVTEEMWRAK